MIWKDSTKRYKIDKIAGVCFKSRLPEEWKFWEIKLNEKKLMNMPQKDSYLRRKPAVLLPVWCVLIFTAIRLCLERIHLMNYIYSKQRIGFVGEGDWEITLMILIGDLYQHIFWHMALEYSFIWNYWLISFL